MVVDGIDEGRKRDEQELPAPPPLCEVVQCDDVEGITLEEALREMGEVEEVADGIYATPYKFKRISPFLLSEYEFCPRLLWLEAREGKKFMTADSLVAAVKGKRLHKRYGQFLAIVYNAELERKVKKGEFVGRVDLVLKYGGKIVPVEVKTSDEKESYRRQLQAYMAMMNASIGYLVYKDRVIAVAPDPSVLDELGKIGEIMRSPRPPPPARDCRQCEYKAACEKYGVIPPTFTS